MNTKQWITKFGLAVLLFFTLAIAFPGRLAAQAISGDVVGAVTDATGAGVPGASISMTNDATGVKTTASSDSAGAYRFANLPPGTYTLTASATGFNATTIKAVQVQLNNTVTQNVALVVGATTATVEVTAAPPPLDTTTAQLQTTFDTRQAEDLPTASLSRSARNRRYNSVGGDLESYSAWRRRGIEWRSRAGHGANGIGPAPGEQHVLSGWRGRQQ